MKNIHIFLAGTGLIGSTLLKQIYQNQERINKSKSLTINLIGIFNQRKMLMNKKGIRLDNWKTALENSGQRTNSKDFLSLMISSNKENSIFIDCTASENIPVYLHYILQSGIHVVTPNKKGIAGSMNLYTEIRDATRKGNTKILYETTVGAGLPIIHTIRNFLDTGDEIIKIEGILSGTLSYLFNNFTKDNTFSDIIKDAKEKGYTEPDPRDDLNGLDFGRKLLILAREIGYEIEIDEIPIENLIPEKVKNTENPENFFHLLEQENSYYENIKQNAKSNGKVPRYIGLIEKGKASCSLQMIRNDHPFYSISNSDNIVAITTKRYTSPLVIKGPGAGAEVTAAAVFADILSLAN